MEDVNWETGRLNSETTAECKQGSLMHGLNVCVLRKFILCFANCL